MSECKRCYGGKVFDTQAGTDGEYINCPKCNGTGKEMITLNLDEDDFEVDIDKLTIKPKE
jgi:hypothetical protein